MSFHSSSSALLSAAFATNKINLRPKHKLQIACRLAVFLGASVAAFAQAPTVASVLHISEPVHDVIEAQFSADPPQTLILRSVANDSNRELWNRCAQLRGRTEQSLETLSGIKAAYAQHSEFVLVLPSRDGLKYLAPGLEIN